MRVCVSGLVDRWKSEIFIYVKCVLMYTLVFDMFVLDAIFKREREREREGLPRDVNRCFARRERDPAKYVSYFIDSYSYSSMYVIDETICTCTCVYIYHSGPFNFQRERKRPLRFT